MRYETSAQGKKPGRSRFHIERTIVFDLLTLRDTDDDAAHRLLRAVFGNGETHAASVSRFS
ncbi:hypothetical protein [Sphingopyxis macrogoltabida]|uniref:Uncharacterized protein n=1 Tax=Sphingopyxis macrogoltabida TaxID=33050 RepID=A0A0N9VAM6_SPHMC|nr:hypothetical protein [Sphingopyxis macrogoltabida]ALH81441.1 hypothetical protein AN936_14030 [Sphingopyxis macrogoltabida]